MKLRRMFLFLPLLFIAAAAQAEVKPLYSQFTLDNGMEVLLIENHRVPAVSHMLWYKVGGGDDWEGKSGLAHYQEHMMFQGTPKVPAGEFAKQVSRLGGVNNAFTSWDYTAYYVNIAKEHLAKVMELEVDRMRNLAPTKDNFLREREVIIEERRMRTDNQPQSLFAEQMRANLFSSHPYHRPVIGWKKEMEGLTEEDVLAFHHRFYHPNNAILVVAGDLTMEELKPLAERYYGKLPKAPLPPRLWKDEPEHKEPRRLEMHHPLVTQALWSKEYIAPSLASGDSAQAMPLYVLAQLLGGGQTSLLYRHLVVEQKIATGADANYSGITRGPGTFSINITPAHGISMAQIEQAVAHEVQSMQKSEAAGPDMERAKTLLKAEVIYARDGLEAMANLFGMLRAVGQPASFFERWPEMIGQVSAKQVRQAANAVLVDAHSISGTLEPEKKEEKGAEKHE